MNSLPILAAVPAHLLTLIPLLAKGGSGGDPVTPLEFFVICCAVFGIVALIAQQAGGADAWRDALCKRVVIPMALGLSAMLVSLWFQDTAFAVVPSTLGAVTFFVGLVSWPMAVHKRKVMPCLQALAGQLGLSVIPAGWSELSWLKGTRRGKAVEVRYHKGGRGGGATVLVSARLARDGGLTFSIEPMNWLEKVDEWVGRRRRTTGDATFDEAWVVRSNRPELFAASLLPELRARLTAASAGAVGGNYELKAGVVTYREAGWIGDAKYGARLPALADLVCDLADIAEVAGGSPPRG